MTRAHFLPIMIAAVGAMASSSAPGQDSHAPATAETAAATALRLGPQEIRRRALERGPGVEAARVAQAEARRVRRATKSIVSFPPRVEVDVARRTFPGGEGADVAARLWQDFSLGGHGASREKAADARVVLGDHEAELARRTTVRRAMQAWVDARLGREILALRAHSRDAAEELLRLGSTRVDQGKAAPIERSLARALAGAARAAALDAEGKVVEADAALRFALGLEPSSVIDVVGDIRTTDDRPIDEVAAVDAALRRHPQLLIASAEAVSAERNAEVAASNGRPVLGVGVMYAREATGDRIVGGALSVPIPVVNPQSYEAASARADAATLRARIRDASLEVARETRLAIHEREHAREVRDALWSGAVEPGRDALRELMLRYESGAADLATVIAARRELLSAEESWLSAAANVHRADLRLEFAVGGDLPRRSGP